MVSPRPNVIKLASPDAVAMEAARRLLARIDAGGERPAVCLTGGSSPRRLYELLDGPEFKHRVCWHRVHWFIGDDRLVPFDDERSNFGMARRVFLDRNAPAANIHPIPTGAETLDDAAQRYERALRAFYGADKLEPARALFSAVLMGLGPDGHTASLFPNAAALHETDRWVVGVPKPNVAPFVPRVTLTLPALVSCEEMLFLVSGSEKASILARVMAGDDLPATRACSRGTTTWLVDAATLGGAA